MENVSWASVRLSVIVDNVRQDYVKWSEYSYHSLQRDGIRIHYRKRVELILDTRLDLHYICTLCKKKRIGRMRMRWQLASNNCLLLLLPGSTYLARLYAVRDIRRRRLFYHPPLSYACKYMRMQYHHHLVIPNTINITMFFTCAYLLSVMSTPNAWRLKEINSLFFHL